jgi:hypothetical protein
MVAPAAFTARAVSSNCSSLSTEHGPAITQNFSAPMTTPSTLMSELDGCDSRLTILNRFCTAHDLFDLGQDVQRFERVMSAFVSDGRDDCLFGAKNRPGIVAEAFHFLDDLVDLLARCVRFDDDDHGGKRGPV